MKEELWAYVLNEEDRFSEIASAAFQKFLENKGSHRFPEYGGRMVRAAIVHMRCDKEYPVEVVAIDFRRCQLTEDGALDPMFKEKRKKLESELASMKFRKRDPDAKVVDASRRFKERRFSSEFTWTPTVSMIQNLSEIIHERSGGHMDSKDALHQMLSLTATA